MANKLTVVAGAGDLVPLSNAVLDVWSKELLFQAQPILRFASVGKIKTELGGKPGKKLSFLKYAALSGSSALTEGVAMTKKALGTSSVFIEVSEHGYAVAVSEFLLKTTFLNIMNDTALLLGRHYATEYDSMCRDALMTCTNSVFSQKGGAAGTRADLTAGSTFDVNAVRDVQELLATLKVPKFGGDAYIGFITPHQARNLREDSAWVNANLYASPENILRGEVGRIENVRFVETTQCQVIDAGTNDIFADSVDTGNNVAGAAAPAGVDVHRAVVVGDYCLGIGETLPVELRDDGVTDFGREHSLAYYGIFGAGLIESSHAVIVETA